MAEILHRVASELREEEAGFECRWNEDARVIELVYAKPDHLRRELPDFLELGAVCVEIGDAPLLEEVTVRVFAAREAVDLMGRTVQKTGTATAIQIYPPQAVVAARLRTLPDRMGAARDDREVLAESWAADDASHAVVAEVTDAGLDEHSLQALLEPPNSTLIELKTAMAQRRSWNLSEVALSDVLLELLASRQRGILEVESSRSWQLLIDGDQLLRVESDPPQPAHAIETLLRQADRIDDQQVAKARAYAEAHAISVREALINLRLIDYESLRLAMKTRLRFLLKKVWGGAKRAKFYALSTELPATLGLPLSVNDVVFGRLLTDFERDPERLRAAEAKLKNKRIRRSADLARYQAYIAFNRTQQDLLEINFRDGRSANEILRLARVSQAEAIAGLTILVAVGALDALDLESSSKVIARGLEHLEVLVSRCESSDKFEALGVHWSAYDEEVEQAHRDLLHRLTPEALADFWSDEVEAKVERVRARLDEAYKVLRHAGRRRTHREQLIDAHRIETTADMFKKQADTAKIRRDVKAALDFYRRIVELCPHDAESREQILLLESLPH